MFSSARFFGYIRNTHILIFLNTLKYLPLLPPLCKNPLFYGFFGGSLVSPDFPKPTLFFPRWGVFDIFLMFLRAINPLSGFAFFLKFGQFLPFLGNLGGKLPPFGGKWGKVDFGCFLMFFPWEWRSLQSCKIFRWVA